MSSVRNQRVTLQNIVGSLDFTVLGGFLDPETQQYTPPGSPMLSTNQRLTIIEGEFPCKFCSDGPLTSEQSLEAISNIGTRYTFLTAKGDTLSGILDGFTFDCREGAKRFYDEDSKPIGGLLWVLFDQDGGLVRF